MYPLIRPEYIDAAIGKSTNPAQLSELESIKLLTQELAAQEALTLQQCVENRIRAGESRKRTAAPASMQSASDKAAEDIHKLELRKCRRAQSASEIIESQRALLRGDIKFNEPLLKYIDLPENRALSEALLAKKKQLLSTFKDFLARWQGARSTDRKAPSR